MEDRYIKYILSLDSGLYSAVAGDLPATVMRDKGNGFTVTTNPGRKEWQTSHYNEAGELQYTETEIE